MIGDLRMLLVCLVSVAMLGLGDNGLRAAEPSQIDSLLRQAVDRGDVPCVVALGMNFKTLSQRYSGANASDVWVALRSIIVEQLGVSPEEVQPAASFVNDLGCD